VVTEVELTRINSYPAHHDIVRGRHCSQMQRSRSYEPSGRFQMWLLERRSNVIVRDSIDEIASQGGDVVSRRQEREAPLNQDMGVFVVRYR
jgi:hypothetical protein